QVENRLGGRIPGTGRSPVIQRTGEQRIDAPFDDIDDARGFRRRALGGELIGVDGLSRNDHGRSRRIAHGGRSCSRIEKRQWLHVTSVGADRRSEEHTSELQSRFDLVCRLLLEKKKSRTWTSVHAVTTSIST